MLGVYTRLNYITCFMSVCKMVADVSYRLQLTSKGKEQLSMSNY